MADAFASYRDQVIALEAGLAPYAKRSLEAFSLQFVDGGDQFKYYADEWQKPSTQSRLYKRTPIQLERDRILYSNGMRKLTEKYHVLYNGPSRIVRNFATHTMRVQQVARALCRGLDLNSDFAEAIALGSKIGALPFVHASKFAVSKWVQQKLSELDAEKSKLDVGRHAKAPVDHRQLQLQFNSPLPAWIQSLTSVEIVESAKRFIPWAAGQDVNRIYSSGQQGYWQLCTNPYSVESTGKGYSPETMYGIWRHSLGCPIGKETFHHRCELKDAASGQNEIRWEHVTYEAIAVQYADDITWVIENLNDAHHAALLNRATSVYQAALDNLGRNLPSALVNALTYGNAGTIYNYFINDFVRHSHRTLEVLGKDGNHERYALREGALSTIPIGLSPDASRYLDLLKQFLDKKVFTEPRVHNRFRMLSTISDVCMNLLYQETEERIHRYIEDKALLERWQDATKDRALSLFGDSVHRIQLAVTIFADMGDQEIYDFVGIQSL